MLSGSIFLLRILWDTLAMQSTEFLFYIPATSVYNGLNISMIAGIASGDDILMPDRDAITRCMQAPAAGGRVGCMLIC
jgi:hypothetical protein